MQIDALSEGLICADFRGKEAVRVDNEGHGTSMRLKIFLGEGVKVILRSDGDLVGKDGTAIVLGGLRRDLILDVARDDGSVPAPDVHLEGEIMADERDLVLLDGRMDDGEGVGTGRALEIFELVDGDRDTGRGAEHGGVAITGCLSERRHAGWNDEEKGGG